MEKGSRTKGRRRREKRKDEKGKERKRAEWPRKKFAKKKVDASGSGDSPSAFLFRWFSLSLSLSFSCYFSRFSPFCRFLASSVFRFFHSFSNDLEKGKSTEKAKWSWQQAWDGKKDLSPKHLKRCWKALLVCQTLFCAGDVEVIGAIRWSYAERTAATIAVISAG